MLLAGVPVPTVAQQAGHSNPSVTLAIYAHVIGDRSVDSALNVFSGGGGASGALTPVVSEA